MKRKSKFSIAIRDSFELANALGLGKEDAVAMDFRARLNKKIIDLAQEQGRTHAEIAKNSKASRTRITAVLNGQTQGISTDFLLRILYSLGCKTTPSFSRIKLAA